MRACLILIVGMFFAQCLPLLQGLQEDAAAGGDLSGMLLAALGGAAGGDPAAETRVQLADLVIEEVAVDSIRLAPPAASSQVSDLQVQVWLGPDDSMRVDGPTVSGATIGPIDVTTSGYEFQGLETETRYRIVVRASAGTNYVIKQIVVVPEGSAPVLNPLRILSTASDRIEVARPTFSTAGSPLPTVRAYIGLQGTIQENAGTITGAQAGPVDVSTADTIFTGLAAARNYQIIVVAENTYGRSVRLIHQNTASIAPDLNELTIAGADYSSITLSRPTLAVAGNPAPTIRAYIGLNGTISVAGDVVTGELAGDIDVSAAAHQFGGLIAGTTYRIIVVAKNVAGYSVMQVVQSTSGFAPVAPSLNNLQIVATDDDSIELAQPSLSVAGNPAPTVRAYIGLNGLIAVNGGTVSNALTGPINVATGGAVFSGLTGNTSYRIIVVAENAAGVSVQEIIQSTGFLIPVLNPLVISNRTSTSITLEKPTFAVNGNPARGVFAWIGVDGEIYSNGAVVHAALGYFTDVTNNSHTFSGLDPAVTYRVIVFAFGAQDSYSTMEIVQGPVAPQLNPLNVWVQPTGITLYQPTFAVDGFPASTLQAWIGLPGQMTLSGTTVTNALQGPVNVNVNSFLMDNLDPLTQYRLIVIATNPAGSSIRDVMLSTEPLRPDLNPLAISGSTGTSITLARPSYHFVPVPRGTTEAFIGVNGVIREVDGVVTGYTGGPVDVSLSGTTFTGLTPNTEYRIIVVARNEAGLSVKQIVQSTTVIAPVLNDIRILSFDDDSLFLGQVTFATAGNPAPTLTAYLGVDGVMEINGSTVTNFLQRSSSGLANGWHAQGLSSYTTYRVIVVAENIGGYSVKQITQRTAGIAPVLNALQIESAGPTSLTLAQPSFKTAGSPTPAVRAYLGLAGVIGVSGTTVSNALVGPVDVSAGSYQFTGLDPAQLYRVIVVAGNVIGSSVQEISGVVHRQYGKASNTRAGHKAGAAMAASGDTVVIGAPDENTCTYGINRTSTDYSCTASGAVYVYVRQGGGYVLQAYIKQPHSSVRGSLDRFGTSVALDGDLLVVGAPGEDSYATLSQSTGDFTTWPTSDDYINVGAAYVYRRSGGVWTFDQMLKGVDPVVGGAYRDAAFGTSVSASNGHIAVGAPGLWNQQGRAFTYIRKGSSQTWHHSAYLKHSVQDGQRCGTSVALDGDTLAFGCPKDDNPSMVINGPEDGNSVENYGSAYVYTWDGTNWNKQAYLKSYGLIRFTVSSSGPADGDFGESIALSGDTVVVGAPNEYTIASGINPTGVGSDPGSGAAYVFTRSGGVWTAQAHLKQKCRTSASSNCENTYFGKSLGFLGDRLIVGMPGDYWPMSGVDPDYVHFANRTNSGAAILFVRNAGVWSQQAFIKSSNTDTDDLFGSSVAISSQGYFVGAPAEDSAATGVDGDQSSNAATDSGAWYYLY